MRKIVLNLAVSLDGFIAGENGEYDWCFIDLDYGMTEFLQQIDAILLGRKSYEVFLAAEADPYPGTTKYVVSNTLKTESEGVVILNGNLEAQIKEIKQLEGKDIYLFGGADLTNSLLEIGLVDELQLSVHPLLLGKGKPLFQSFDERRKLSLLEVKEYPTGLVQLFYQVESRR
ncbi:MAG: dihydrofolate reductase family protein [Cyanosarcina radialis HA8281-LM2]|jgi:dihydrofolate reductase|nr:dihydrofolate reductase family protein [Cyanosarcina radialis HA8281-LM2]